MKSLIQAPLFINLIYFIIGILFGINPGMFSYGIVVSSPGGYVFQIQISILVFSLMTVVIGLSFIGIRILGSGLGDTSVSIINRAVVYFLLWAVFSTVSFGFLSSIPTFGYIIYGALSIFYAVGVFNEMATIGGGDSPAQGTGGGSE